MIKKMLTPRQQTSDATMIPARPHFLWSLPVKCIVRVSGGKFSAKTTREDRYRKCAIDNCSWEGEGVGIGKRAGGVALPTRTNSREAY
jgi:hypothetical protein